MNFTHLTKSQRAVYNALYDMDWDRSEPALNPVEATLELHGRFNSGKAMTETVVISAHGRVKRTRRCECNRGCHVMIDDPEEIHTKVVWVNGVLQRHKGHLSWRRGRLDRHGMSASLVQRWAKARTLVSRGGTKNA